MVFATMNQKIRTFFWYKKYGWWMFIDVQQKILSQHGGFRLPQASGDLGWNPTTAWEFQGCFPQCQPPQKDEALLRDYEAHHYRFISLIRPAILCVWGKVTFFYF